MHYYLQVDYNQNTNAKIFADEYIYVINKGDEIDVGITMVVAPNQFNALLGQQCHLVISPDWRISQTKEEKYDKTFDYDKYMYGNNAEYKMIDNCLIYNHSSVQNEFKEIRRVHD